MAQLYHHFIKKTLIQMLQRSAEMEDQGDRILETKYQTWRKAFGTSSVDFLFVGFRIEAISGQVATLKKVVKTKVEILQDDVKKNRWEAFEENFKKFKYDFQEEFLDIDQEIKKELCSIMNEFCRKKMPIDQSGNGPQNIDLKLHDFYYSIMLNVYEIQTLL